MRRIVFVPLAFLVFLGGCTPPAAPPPPVPPLPREDIPLPPVSGIQKIWRPGHFDWTTTNYVWVPGEWIDREGTGTMWQDGYWAGVPPDTKWIPGHWL